MLSKLHEFYDGKQYVSVMLQTSNNQPKDVMWRVLHVLVINHFLTALFTIV